MAVMRARASSWRRSGSRSITLLALWNTARLHGACDSVPRAEYEAANWANVHVADAA